jgi:Fe-S cluster assembly protein SufD
MTTLTSQSFKLIPAQAPVQLEGTPEHRQLTVPSGCELSIVETYPAQSDSIYMTQTTLTIVLEDNARLTHYKVVQEGAQCTHQSMVEVQVAKAAAYTSHVFLLGGAHVRSTVHVRLNGEQAECALNGLYMASGNQEMENHTLIEHAKPHGTSRELYKGILDDQSRGVFDGLIIVQKDAQKTDSTQTNKNLLLSDKAKATSNPELKIFANDVKCKHGATIGQLNPDQLFYLRSRGLSQLEARRLLIHAFASEMIQLVQIPELRDTLSATIVGVQPNV